MTEEEWYEKIEELLHQSERGGWNRIINRAVEAHRHYRLRPERKDREIEEILHGLIRKMEGFPPTWMVIAGPDLDIETPDDLWIHPAWSEVEVQILWDLHDGRSAGTLVVGVYVWRQASRAWERDQKWGIMGNASRTGPAVRSEESDRLC